MRLVGELHAHHLVRRDLTLEIEQHLLESGLIQRLSLEGSVSIGCGAGVRTAGASSKSLAIASASSCSYGAVRKTLPGPVRQAYVLIPIFVALHLYFVLLALALRYGREVSGDRARCRRGRTLRSHRDAAVQRPSRDRARTLGALSRGLAPAARMAMLSRQPSRRTLTHQLWVHDNNLSQGAHRLIDSRPPFRPCRVVCRSSGQARVLAR